MKKFLIRLSLRAAEVLVLYGIILPALFSAKSTAAVVAGFCLAAILTPVVGYRLIRLADEAADLNETRKLSRHYRETLELSERNNDNEK